MLVSLYAYLIVQSNYFISVKAPRYAFSSSEQSENLVMICVFHLRLSDACGNIFYDRGSRGCGQSLALCKLRGSLARRRKIALISCSAYIHVLRKHLGTTICQFNISNNYLSPATWLS